MDEFQESDVLWPEEDMMSQLRLAYAAGQHQGRQCASRGEGLAAGSNAKESAPIAIPRSAPAGRRRYRSWSVEFAPPRGEDSRVDVEEDAKEMVPPHVLVARRLSGKMEFSVCTGQGRTLKGRDLSQVRNSILRLTGFLEG